MRAIPQLGRQRLLTRVPDVLPDSCYSRGFVLGIRKCGRSIDRDSANVFQGSQSDIERIRKPGLFTLDVSATRFALSISSG